ncbi:DUF1671-domain-containing protein [Obba rivulosa]|uniref:DUF1671-domain-containing protein n=1 Tax=Obba rivulosa TaxID=1052685 RepID=A0A8E2AVF9_9APHY|nr:DUF1671-domain-containing protein [Obba rivulosa]
MQCQVLGCSRDLASMTVGQRQAHYDTHFAGDSTASMPGPSSPQGGDKHTPGTFNIPRFEKVKQYIPLEKQNVFWFSLQATEPPPNFSPGLIPVIRKALIRMHERGFTQRAWLCHDLAVHISSELWDRGWGCGYRNCLMSCASLMAQQKQPVYFPLLDHPTPPGVRNVQTWIEEAWRNGYDEEGASQLKHKLLGTRKWIGTGELYAAFTFLRIPSQLVDFDLTRGVDVLVDWIVEYFSSSDSSPHKGGTVDDVLWGASPVVVTDKLPIILQHAGHSRTVIGFERSKSGSISLLVFDPSKRIPVELRSAGLTAGNTHHSPKEPARHGKVLQPLMHPIQTLKAHKRKPGVGESGSPKRQRIEGREAGGVENPIVIDDDDDGNNVNDHSPKASSSGDKHVQEPDPKQVLNVFRVAAKALGKKDKYQILYFPLDDPLEDRERSARKVVTSLKIS